jgi:hypothetical protein
MLETDPKSLLSVRSFAYSNMVIRKRAIPVIKIGAACGQNQAAPVVVVGERVEADRPKLQGVRRRWRNKQTCFYIGYFMLYMGAKRRSFCTILSVGRIELRFGLYSTSRTWIPSLRAAYQY